MCVKLTKATIPAPPGAWGPPDRSVQGVIKAVGLQQGILFVEEGEMHSVPMANRIVSVESVLGHCMEEGMHKAPINSKVLLFLLKTIHED